MPKGGSLILVDERTRELVFELALGPTADNLLGTRMAWGQGLVGETASTGKPLIVDDAATDPRWFSGYDEATDFVTRSILCAPMVTRQEVLGVLEIVNKKDGSAFDENEAELLMALATQAAAALANARLYAATRRQANEVSALLETSQAVNSTLDLDQRLKIIGQRAQELVTADGCTVFLLNEETGVLKPIIALDRYAEETMRTKLQLGEGITGQVALSGKGRIANHAHLDPDAVQVPDTPIEPECLLSVPLKVKGMTIGVMTLTRLGQREFNRHDLELISSLGNQVAVAIENARLYNATRQRNTELAALYNIAMSVGQTLKLPQLLEEILRQVPPVLDQEGGLIYLYKDDQLELAHQSEVSGLVRAIVDRQPWCQEALAQTVELGRAVEAAPSAPGRDGEQTEQMRLVCLPLVARQHILGVLAVPILQHRTMRAQDRRLLETLGRQIGMAVENAMLYEELQERAENLQQAYDDLAQVDRMKDELVQNISHELRTPITFIKGYVSLILDGDLGDLTDDQVDSLKIVSNKTEQLIQLVNGILTLQTLTRETLKMEPVAPLQIAESAAAGATLAAQEAGINIVIHHSPELPPVIADTSRITQVFDNLLQNALKFSPEGSTVTIRLTADEAQLQVDVQDTGIGIPEDKLDHVFDRFFQVDGSMTRRYGGTGLGLAICKQIVDFHDGKIWVESQVGVGSTFSFTLPLATADLRNPA